MPAVILAMLAGGWKSSASANGTRSRWLSAAPSVVFPEPDTPMTSRSGAAVRCLALIISESLGRCFPHTSASKPLFQGLSEKNHIFSPGVAHPGSKHVMIMVMADNGRTGLHGSVLDQLGLLITSGELPAGQVLRI